MEELSRWLAGAERGEEAAYRELYRVYRPAVVRLLAGFAALDGDDVEDVVQDSFVRAFRSLKGLREPRAFEAWLLTIARNRAVSFTARAESGRRARALLEVEPAPPQGLFPEALSREVEGEVVRALIAELPEGPEKQTVELFYVQGELSAREIADRLGVGKSAITMRLERFRARVKKELLRRLLRRAVG